MESDIDCSVCVVVNSNNYIRRFLDSLFRTAEPVSLEIVVINTGLENELDYIEKEFPGIIIYENSTREPMARTRNRIFELARGRYLSFWSDEIIFQTACLFHLINFLDDNPAVGIVGPSLLTANQRPLVSSARFPGLFSWLWGGTSLAAGGIISSADTQAEIDWLSGAALVINPNLIDDIGLFDQGFPCGEEVDYCFRAHRAGWHIHLVPAARAVYRYPALKQNDWTWSRELYVGLRFLKKKWLATLKK